MNISNQQINTLLQEEDIEGLLQDGAPADEYSSEAEVIALALSELDEEQYDNEMIEGIIALAWGTSFDLSESDLSSRQFAIQSLANKIVGILKPQK